MVFVRVWGLVMDWVRLGLCILCLVRVESFLHFTVLFLVSFGFSWNYCLWFRGCDWAGGRWYLIDSFQYVLYRCCN
ncbi:hypothetical protein BDD12DRAFT_838513 [Trichophaea hybrida]|nr:hypothetical protein BDD12DRAFT_838513 [Trichophaea hybrida]